MTLLGPSHAEEVARQLPTAVVLSGGEAPRAARVQGALSTNWLRIYTNDDQIGTEYAAALKNILAIAAGMCDGLGLGDNTKGALLTRGLAEISRLGVALGGRAETFYGLSGVGDVITTCLSHHSRNRALGERVAKGESLAAALAAIDQTVEGVATVRTTVALAEENGIKMPISRQVLAVLDEAKDPSHAIDELMGRALRSEREVASAKRRGS
jgi:glycerol-3-phosphate dehydrogenase (NAD(P)+)